MCDLCCISVTSRVVFYRILRKLKNEKFVMSKYDKDVPTKASISFFPPFRVQWLCQPSSVCSFCGDVPTMGADSQEDPIHQRGPLLRLGASHHRHGHQQVGCACLCGFLTHSAAFVFLSYYCCIHWWCHRAYQQPRLHTIPDPDPQNRRKPHEASFCTCRSLPLLAMRKTLQLGCLGFLFRLRAESIRIY